MLRKFSMAFIKHLFSILLMQMIPIHYSFDCLNNAMFLCIVLPWRSPFLLLPILVFVVANWVLLSFVVRNPFSAAPFRCFLRLCNGSVPRGPIAFNAHVRTLDPWLCSTYHITLTLRHFLKRSSHASFFEVCLLYVYLALCIYR